MLEEVRRIFFSKCSALYELLPITWLEVLVLLFFFDEDASAPLNIEVISNERKAHVSTQCYESIALNSIFGFHLSRRRHCFPALVDAEDSL